MSYLTLRSAAWALALVAVVTLTTGCPLVVPWPGEVNANHNGTALDGLPPDAAVVVIAARDGDARRLEATVSSCVRDALGKHAPAPRVILPDEPLRRAFATHHQ